MPPVAILVLCGSALVVAIFAVKYLKVRRDKTDLRARNAALEKRAFALALGGPERSLTKLVREAGSDEQLYYFREGSEASRRQQALRYISRYKDHVVFRLRDIEPLDVDLWKTGEQSLGDIFAERDPESSKKKGRQHALGVLSSIMTTLVHSTGGSDEIEGCIAGNCALMAELPRLYAQVGLISDEEAWGLLYLNAEYARAMFPDWSDYIEAWEKNLLGVADYYEGKDIKVMLKEISAVAAKQKKRSVNWPSKGVFDDLHTLRRASTIPNVKQRQGA